MGPARNLGAHLHNRVVLEHWMCNGQRLFKLGCTEKGTPERGERERERQREREREKEREREREPKLVGQY